jgi:hypothetical protein
MAMLVGTLVVVAYVISYPAFAWTYFDLRRYPRQLWSGFGSPHPWRQATVIAYIAGGIPVFVVAFAWRSSAVRREMRAAAHRSERR